MSPDDRDDLDDFLDNGRGAELEARFQELELDAEIEQMRQEAGTDARRERDHRPPQEPEEAAEPAARKSAGKRHAGRKPSGSDPLQDMKDALDSEAEPEKFLLVVCLQCGARNRMSLSRVRSLTPICGRCKAELAALRHEL
jgi:ribosomal protein L40E